MNNPNLGGAGREEYGGRVEEQIDIARRGLDYGGRFQTPQPGPGTTQHDRWADIDRASGGK
jgi:hypothetical protein